MSNYAKLFSVHPVYNDQELPTFIAIVLFWTVKKKSWFLGLFLFFIVGTKKEDSQGILQSGYNALRSGKGGKVLNATGCKEENMYETRNLSWYFVHSFTFQGLKICR